MKATEIYEKTTAAILSQLETATGNWTAPWHSTGFLPTNATTYKAYQGGNTLILWATQIDQAYPTAEWATYKQWESFGAQVRKGEKGTGLVKWSPVIDRRTKGTADERQVLVPSGFTVFNAAQVDGYVPPAQHTVDLSEQLDHVDAFFDALGATITEGSPCYIPSFDQIQLPPIKDFYDHLGFYAVSAHEHAHWTGHKSRLDRKQDGGHGSADYAFEELVAEISASFTAAYLGFETTPRPDHAEYIKHWSALLHEDPQAIFKAASLAQKATNFLIEKAEA